MTTRTKVIILSSIAIISYAGFFIYQRRQRQKSNEVSVTLEEAYKILDKQK